jgi:acyl-homoserine-lactone acylase
MRTASRSWAPAAVLALLIAMPIALQRRAAGLQAPTLRATIQTTAYGVPHVTADSFAALGFGAGFAYARQAICDMAGRFVTVRAERSRYFGPDERVPDGPGRALNLESDFFWQRILDLRLVERELAQAPPLGPGQDLKELVRGYAAGYNEYLSRTGVDGLPDARCRGQAWVRPITEKDLYLRAMHWNLYRSGGSIIPQIVAAAPPASSSSRAAAGPTVQDVLQLESMRGLGSNMIALGADATDNNRGMLFANPHWTWEGPDRWFEIHLRIPGRLDVYGVQTSGLPVIQTGFNEHVAWAGTSSVATRWTVHELTLAPGAPTSYLYDGKARAMVPRVVRVQALRPDGRLESREHTFWETHFGPMLQDATLAWTGETAYAMRDVAYSFRWLSQQLSINLAASAREIGDSGKQYMAIGWRNLAAADDRGNVFYGDRTAIPNVSDRQISACPPSRVARDAPQYARMLLLDGSRSSCEWGAAPDAPVPGILAASQLPELHRRDYVLQSNDTHWLNSLRQPLEGYPGIMGEERTPRTLRTRNALRKVESRLNGSDGHAGRRFTLPLLKTITMDNRVFSADVWLNDAVSACQSLAQTEDLGNACGVLAAWDRTENIESRGALLWRRFVERLGVGRRQGWQDLFVTRFDAKDPVGTPSGLDVTNPRVPAALRSAVADLRNGGIPLDAPLGAYQYAVKGREHIPISGGPDFVGQYNVATSRSGWVAGAGYPDIDSGAGFIMWMQFTDAGPVGESVLTFSQSPNPTSPHFADQTRLWSAMRTKPMRFKQGDILADPALETMTICASRSANTSC